MSTVNRKYPTYRDLLEALQAFGNEDLDLPIKIRSSENDEYTNALFEYDHEMGDTNGPQVGFVVAPQIEDNDTIKYNVVEDYCGEIIKQNLTFPEVVSYCCAENLTIKSFDNTPNAYGQFYCEVTGYYKE